MLRLFLLCVVLALPAPLLGQQADGGEILTLDDALRLAVAQNRQLRSAALEVARAEDRVEAERTRRLPTLQFGATGAYLPTSIDLRFEQGTFGTFPGVGPVPPQSTTISTGPGFAAGLSARVVQYPDARSADSMRISPVPSSCGASGSMGRSPFQ